MKFLRPTSALLLLLTVGCVTPSASVTDLTKKNLQNAEVLASAHEASLASMEQFLAEVESSELAYLKEAKKKIERLTHQALLEKLEAVGAEYRSRFDDALWKLRGEEFEEMVDRDFRSPFDAALEKDRESTLAIMAEASKFPGDVPLQKDSANALKAHEMARLSVDKEERILEERAARVTASARRRFAESQRASLEHYRLMLEGLTEKQDNSFASILSAQEVVRVEKAPISYKKHRAVLESWGKESTARMRSHMEALDAADRYLSGKKLSFLFVEGSEELKPLALPAVPTVTSLGLGDSLVQLRARETALLGLAEELEKRLERDLSEVRELLAATVRKTRSELEERLPFLKQPR